MAKSRHIPNVLNKEQIYSLFDAINSPDIMMACILALFCGLRIGEVAKLSFNDADIVKKQLKVVNGKLPGKTLAGYGKDRVIPIPTQIIPLIVMWKNMHTNAEYFFPSLTKLIDHTTPEHIFRKYKKYLGKANLIVFKKLNSVGHRKNVYNFHTLRHTYATILWERTGDIYAVKQALGHNDLDTTMIYTHVSDIALQNKINNAFEIPLSYKQKNIQLENKSSIIEQKNQNLIQNENPIELLKIRLAKGEIKLEDFRQLRSELIVTPDTNYFG